MTHQRPRNHSLQSWGWTLLALVAAACSAAAPDVGQARSAAFTNGGFETGAAGLAPPAPWVLTDLLNPNPNGVTIQTPQTYAGLNLVTQGMACASSADCAAGEFGTCQGGLCLPSAKTVTLNGAAQPDPTLGAAAALRWPRYGAQCALINQLGNLSNVNQLAQTMTIGAGDVDPGDGRIHVRLTVAPVLEDPGHPNNQQPYFFVQLSNLTQSTVLYEDYNFSNQPGVPWQTLIVGARTYRYTDWQLIDISPGSPALNMGDTVALQLIASGCSIGGHMGELYVDGVGATVPGLFVSGTGPAQDNAGSNLTYTFNYQNGSPLAATAVVIDFTTPPGTTFQSLVPPTGATCLSPAAGAAGAVICTFNGPVAAAAAGQLSITVGVNAAVSGPLVAGNYGIVSAQESHLLGNKVATLIGCAHDSDCPAGQWCNESAALCTPALANGTPIPADPPHMNPALSGICTAAAGALTCASGVCDTKDNACGYANSDGACTAGNGDVVCRSGVCDPDGVCGYANGDGPCTGVNGPALCRSGVCSISGVCEPSGGCVVDADCPASDWCNETTGVCTAKRANGAPVPSDAAHKNPALSGTCTAAAGALTCASGVCDPADNECGYADGDGPCTVVGGPVLCRSGACSVSGVCEPAGRCEVDADCPASGWCQETAKVCTPKLANGAPLPSDAAHANPALSGLCTAAAATLTCQSGVCDADGKCGYANGDGPCTAMSAATVCRSGVCSSNGTCEAAGGCDVDADCPAGDWCHETNGVCSAKLANGAPVPSDAPHQGPALSGACTAAAATLVCASGVCDARDNQCGYADGDGPCQSDGQCRNQSCDPASNTCLLTNLPAGAACQRSDQCQSGGCAQGVCSTTSFAGHGLSCSTRPGGAGGPASGVVFLLALLATSLGRRRRRA